MAACKLVGNYGLSEKHAASSFIQTICFFKPLIKTYQTIRCHVGCCVSEKHVLLAFTV
jgi:hypothetical protein